MEVKNFNKKYLTTKVIFNKEEMRRGQVIRVYRCDVIAKNGIFQHMGLIEDVDSVMIKYAYVDEDQKGTQTGYIHASDIPQGATDERWVSEDPYYIFEVVATSD